MQTNEVNGQMQRADYSSDQILRGEAYNRILLYAIVVLLGIANMLILFIKIF